jgi:hypothetical protein
MEKSIDAGYQLALPRVGDLVNQLAVIVGHCDRLIETLNAGPESVKRVSVVKEIARVMAKEFEPIPIPTGSRTRV